MINATVILAPLLVEVALTFGLLFWSGAMRVQAVLRGGPDRDAALRDALTAPAVGRIGEAARGEMEMPALFYLVVVLSQLTATASMVLVALFWVFVATRLAYVLIELTTNDKGRRFLLHWLGVAVLGATWVVFAARILFDV
ncbi:MAG: MAPEG family protein [Bauldia sp.]